MRVKKEFVENKRCFLRWVSNLCGTLILFAVCVIKYNFSKFPTTGDSTFESPVVEYISDEQILARDHWHSLAMFGESLKGSQVSAPRWELLLRNIGILLGTNFLLRSRIGPCWLFISARRFT